MPARFKQAMYKCKSENDSNYSTTCVPGDLDEGSGEAKVPVRCSAARGTEAGPYSLHVAAVSKTRKATLPCGPGRQDGATETFSRKRATGNKHIAWVRPAEKTDENGERENGVGGVGSE